MRVRMTCACPPTCRRNDGSAPSHWLSGKDAWAMRRIWVMDVVMDVVTGGWMTRSWRVLTVVGTALVLSVAVGAQRSESAADRAWPYWRGQAQNGVAPGDAPTQWSDTANVAWKIEIPG